MSVAKGCDEFGEFGHFAILIKEKGSCFPTEQQMFDNNVEKKNKFWNDAEYETTRDGQ